MSNKKNQNLFDFSVHHHNIVKRKIVEQNCHTKFKKKNTETLKINFILSKRFFIDKKIDPYIMIHYTLRVHKLLFIKI